MQRSVDFLRPLWLLVIQFDYRDSSKARLDMSVKEIPELLVL